MVQRKRNLHINRNILKNFAELLQDKRLTRTAENWSWISYDRNCIFQKFVHFSISSENIYEGTTLRKSKRMSSLDDTLNKIKFRSQNLKLALKNFSKSL